MTRLRLQGPYNAPPTIGGRRERPALAWRLIPQLVLVAWLAALVPSPVLLPSTQAAAPCPVPSKAYPTIQAAVNRATCATINVAAGTYAEFVTIARDVTLRGEGPHSTVIDGGGHGPVLTITGGTVTVTGVTIQNGAAGPVLGPGNNGGAIANGGTLTFENSIFSDNGAFRGGGGIDNLGTLTIKDSTFSNNVSSGPNGSKLAPERLRYQSLTQFLPGCAHQGEGRGSPLLDTRLHPIRADEERLRGRRTQAPIGHPHSPCVHARMDCLHRGQAVRHAGRGPALQAQAGAGLDQPQPPRCTASPIAGADDCRRWCRAESATGLTGWWCLA
jgi:hypothetical protein